MAQDLKTATLGGGCFWCTEAIFRRLKGVQSVVSGYSGGNVDRPSYYDVSAGDTNHAEVIQITFDPHVIPYEKLLEIFFHTHNPTTLNRQGADVGTQYRSVIFYHDEDQKRAAHDVKKKVEDEGVYHDPIVTTIEPFKNFYQAEESHQEYYERNKNSNPYCTVVIDPKVKKLLTHYKQDVKEEYTK